MSEKLMNTYARQPVAFERGEGAWLWDTEGRKYLDAVTGIAVCGLGHAHPRLRDALCEQAGTLVHTSNLYRIPLQERLAEELTRLSGMDRAFFCNSGAEANEAAIKLARLYGHQRGIHEPTVVVMENSFHGRTLATLTATGNRKVQAGFEPLVKGFIRAPYGDLEALRSIAQNSAQVVAVLLEPVQGEGGVNGVDADYLRAVRSLCDEQEWLMMLDEVQSGIGRTGHWFAFQASGIVPDVMALAKGLGNGFPVGACMAHGAAAELFQPGNHGTTFGGNPLACRAALTVLEVMEQEGLVARAAALGERLLSGLRERLAGQPRVVDIRGFGLMIGIELDRPCGALVGAARERGLLINVTAERVIRLLPPLVLSDGEADELVDAVAATVAAFAD